MRSDRYNHCDRLRRGECPDFFELPIDGDENNKTWVFWGGNGNYALGSSDGKRFRKTSGPHPSKYGANDYAAHPRRQSGVLGDWCCHLMNAFYKILDPGYPVSVECIDSTGPAIDSYPKGKTVKWHFAADGERPAFDAYWYDGVHQPPKMPGLEDDRKMGPAGSYLVGTKGTCWVVGSHDNSVLLVPETRRKEFGKPKTAAPPSRGHETEFLMAARGEIPYNAPLSHFGYGGKLTAVALMGNIAVRVKGKLLYDAKEHRFTNSDEANKLMTRKPRDGWYVG